MDICWGCYRSGFQQRFGPENLQNPSWPLHSLILCLQFAVTSFIQYIKKFQLSSLLFNAMFLNDFANWSPYILKLPMLRNTCLVQCFNPIIVLPYLCRKSDAGHVQQRWLLFSLNSRAVCVSWFVLGFLHSKLPCCIWPWWRI